MAVSTELLMGLLLAVLLVGAALGFLAGRYSASRPFRDEIATFASSETLGRMLTPKQQEEYAVAYHDPATALREMDQIGYAIPNVSTPFVGTGPAPGRSGNVFVNSRQCRGQREVKLPKPAGTCRLFITGGSAAFGAGAPNDDAIISAYVERSLAARPAKADARPVEVFTLANPAWTSTHERVLIENRLSQFEPDLVLSFSGLNDAHWSLARDTFWLRTYADEHHWKMLNLARHLGGVSPMPEVTNFPVHFTPEQVADRLQENVCRSGQVLARLQARYVFVLQPMIIFTSKPLSAREGRIRDAVEPATVEHFTKCFHHFRARLRHLEPHVRFLDFSDIFARCTATDEIFLDAYHFADRGNELIGRRLAQDVAPLLADR